MHTHSPQRGFIALISVLIISAVMIVTVLSLAQFGVASRYFLLDLENKTASENLASACVQIARVLAYNDPVRVYDNHVETVGSESCIIDHLAPGGGTDSVVEACGKRDKAITNYRVVINHTNGTFVSWEEKSTPSTLPPACL